ncbi:hypothetical protein BDP27DRAFT_266731 [Rhodocollybia butyracea]|uniref:RING-type domain-containing protein n=1 Tax=Rhodocollybia butyracea TaxID=206335 RepID=A0A9P5Q594_9AGAR|nr:hypothetical protein BDP27DRAFT_266731 [Rhodocollybia butyracea]
MATHYSEDEDDQFDLPDEIDFSAIGDDEWNAMQTQQISRQSGGITASREVNSIERVAETRTAGPEFIQGSSSHPLSLPLDSPAQSVGAETPSNGYFSDDGDFDDAFLNQLDQLETQLLNTGASATAPSSAAPGPAQLSPGVNSNPSQGGTLKRYRSPDSNDELATPYKKGKSKYEGDWTDMLDAYEDELTCPICYDVLVAAHLVNGCGHTLCGPCGHSWIVEKHRDTCPTCRTKCHALTPLIPNITADNFVQTHLRLRAALGDEGWKEGGSKLLEWQARKE